MVPLVALAASRGERRDAAVAAEPYDYPAEQFKKLDTNGDGKISKAEAQANAPRLYEHFDQLDTNKDGFLTPDELKAAHGERHPK